LFVMPGISVHWPGVAGLAGREKSEF